MKLSFIFRFYFALTTKLDIFNGSFNTDFLSGFYYLLSMNKNIAIGADIGGSHISCAAIDLASGKILRETLTERAVNNQAQANVIIDIWANALSDVLSKVPLEKVKGIGFAMPGPFDYVKGICYIRGVAKYENLYGINITDAISGRLDVHGRFPHQVYE